MADRLAKRVELDGRGLFIDGTRVPYFIGTDVSVEREFERGKSVLQQITVTLLAEEVVIREPLPSHTRVELTHRMSA